MKKRSIILFLASGAYSGYISRAPGTWGTLAGLPICYLVSLFSLPIQCMLILIFLFFSAWICGEGEKYLGTKDPGIIVIDEIAGIMVTMAFLPFTWFNIVWGVILFRCFDILKPYPISKAETFFQGGTGVLMDDIIAGIFARFFLEMIIIIL